MNSVLPETKVPSASAPLPDSTHISQVGRDVYEQYQPMVRRIGIRLIRRLPREVSLDEILSAGWLGLVEALGRRDACPTQEQFEAYAAHRVRGAMLDYLRSLDPMSRRHREASRSITTAIRELTQAFGRSPSEEEIAKHLGLDLETYFSLLAAIGQAEPVRLEVADLGRLPERTLPQPEQVAADRELASLVAQGINQLPERLQLVLGLYYQEDCSLAEIGELLGVTESRVCQLHTECIHRLRAHLDGSFDDTTPQRTRRTRRTDHG